MQNLVELLDTNFELEKYSKVLKNDIENLEQIKTNNWDDLISKISNFKFGTWPTDKKVTFKL